jgi:hypothetical protein
MPTRSSPQACSGNFRRDSGWDEWQGRYPNEHWLMEGVFRRARGRVVIDLTRGVSRGLRDDGGTSAPTRHPVSSKTEGWRCWFTSQSTRNSPPAHKQNCSTSRKSCRSRNQNYGVANFMSMSNCAVNIDDCFETYPCFERLQPSARNCTNTCRPSNLATASAGLRYRIRRG